MPSRLKRIMSKFTGISTVLMAGMNFRFKIRWRNLTRSHLTAAMPEKYRKAKGAKPRGVANRNLGLTWIINNVDDGVVYFADDDNTYDLRLFQEVVH